VIRILKSSGSRLGDTAVSVRVGEVRLTNPRSFSLANQCWSAFAARAFSVHEVESLEIDRDRGCATVRYRTQAVSVADFIERFSQALATPAPPANDALTRLGIPLAERQFFRLTRYGTRISTWEVLHALPGRMRVRDLGLQNRPELARRLELELRTQPGILSVSARSLTGTVVLRFDPTLVRQADVLRLLDQSMKGLATRQPLVSMPGNSQWSMAQASLGLALAGQFVLPALVPLSAGLLLVVNLPNFREAWLQVRQRQVGLPVLYVAIVVGTLATGGYIAASCMSLCMLFWQQRRGLMTVAGQHALASAIERRPAVAWCVRDAVELEVPAADLRHGEVFLVRPGELVPADGLVVQGSALLDEPAAVGAERLVSRGIGQSVLAGSFVVDGELRVETRRSGEQTLVRSVSRSLAGTLQMRLIGPLSRPPELANRAVPPALMMAGIGLLVGDATTATAIMRPDYASGPQLGDDLTTIVQVGQSVSAGVVVRRADIFQRLGELDLLLFDRTDRLDLGQTVLDEIHAVGQLAADELLVYAACALRELHDPRAAAVDAACLARGLQHPDITPDFRAGGIEFDVHGHRLRVENMPVAENASPDSASSDFEVPDVLAAAVAIRCDGELQGSLTFRTEGYAHQATFRALRNRFGQRSGVFIPTDSELDETFAALGLEAIFEADSDQARAELIDRLVREGRRVGYVGDTALHPATARAAHVAISTAAHPDAHTDVSAAWMFGPEYHKLVALFELASAGRVRSETLVQFAVVPNVVCIAGAFLLGFTSLAAVALTNLGTIGIYSGHTARLKSMERRLMTRRNRFLRFAPSASDSPPGSQAPVAAPTS